MQYLEVSEVSRVTGISEQYLRALCRSERISFKKEPVSHGSKKTKYLIDIDDEFFKNYSSEKQSESDSDVFDGEIVKEAKQVELNRSISEVVSQVATEIRYFADIAIQTAEKRNLMLEDSEKRKDEKLIELMAENKFLKEKNAILEEENAKLKEFKIFGIKIK